MDTETLGSKSRSDQHRTAQRSRMTFPALLAVALLAACIVINPFREMCTWDDSFAYARMVQHLLSTGHYRLDSWAAASMPVQIYLAAGLAKIFGYSLSLLRCTTICLFAVGIASFYRLLRQLGYSDSLAMVLTLAIPATPLVLMLAFTFMSDVQCFGWLMLALLLYVRGIRDQSVTRMVLGSLAAGCAIGTRQFGIAILIGLTTAWLSPSRRPPLKLFFAGITIPLLAAVGQILSGLSTPNLTQTLRLVQTHEFLASPASLLLKELLWRCAVLAQYIGISLLVLLPLVFGLPRTFWTSRILRVPLWLLALIACSAVVAGLSVPSVINARPEALQGGIRIPLEMYWLLQTKLWSVPRIMWLLDVGGIAGGALLLVFFVRALHTRAHRRPEKLLLAGTGLGLLALHLIYRQLNDTYITSLIPFALLMVGESLRTRPQRSSLLRASAVTAMVCMLATALWMRGEYAAQQAVWKSADKLLGSGVQPLDVWAPCWDEYHGSFDAWIAAGAPGYDLKNPRHYPDPLHDPYHLWRQTEWDQAHYRVRISSALTAPPGWQLIAAQSYRAANLSRRYALLLVRLPGFRQPSTESGSAVQ